MLIRLFDRVLPDVLMKSMHDDDEGNLLLLLIFVLQKNFLKEKNQR